MGVDTNVRRVEGDSRQSDMVYRLVLDADGAFRPSRRTALRLGYQAGAQHFAETSAEDGLYQRFNGGLTVLAASSFAVGLTASANDRTTRDPAQPQDYTRLSGGPRLDLRLGHWALGVHGLGERLFFKPNPDFNATGLGATLSVGYRLDSWRFGVIGGVLARDFEGLRTIRIGTGAEGPILVAGEGRREDTSWRAGANARYLGGWLGELEYVAIRNESNTYGGTFTRHQVKLSGTTEIPLGVVLSGKVGLQRDSYEDPQFIDIGGRIEDEGRSSLSVRLERPFSEAWSAVVTGGWWFSPSGAGPEYTRQNLIAGVAFNDVD